MKGRLPLMGEDKSIPPPNTRRQGGMRNEHRHPHPFGAYLPMSHVGLERGGKKLRWLSSFIPRPQLLLPSTHQLPSSHSNTPRRRSLMGSVVMASRSIKFVSTDSSINQVLLLALSLSIKNLNSFFRLHFSQLLTLQGGSHCLRQASVVMYLGFPLLLCGVVDSGGRGLSGLIVNKNVLDFRKKFFRAFIHGFG